MTIRLVFLSGNAWFISECLLAFWPVDFDRFLGETVYISFGSRDPKDHAVLRYHRSPTQSVRVTDVILDLPFASPIVIYR